MKLALPQPGQSAVLSGVTWAEFKTLLDEESVCGRFAYDRGTLEITPLGYDHETVKTLLRRFVEIIIEESDLEWAAAGSTTLLSETDERGIEPDEAYYVGPSAIAVRGIKDLDLERHPPPDLALEIDITASSLSKCRIYRSLRIGEVWRARETTLEFLRPRDDGEYDELAESAVFPGVRAADLLRFLELRRSTGVRQILRAFREWVRGTGRRGGGDSPGS